MTVLPFRRPTAAARANTHEAVGTAVSGTFRSPTGRWGAFTGCYRLDACAPLDGTLTAVGVFTGALVDADGTRIAVASRRHAAAVTALHSGSTSLIGLGPLEVDLTGFRVHVDELVLDVGGTPSEPAVLAALWLLDARQAAAERRPSLRDLLAAVVVDPSAGARPHEHPSTPWSRSLRCL